jgi:hypothetical protein
MKCKRCKTVIDPAEVKSNGGKCPLCKQPAGKKYRYPARPRQKGKSKRMQQEKNELRSATCAFTGGRFNDRGICRKAGIHLDNTLCHRCLK